MTAASTSEAVGRLFALDQDLINDPYPVYVAMRAEQPVMRVGSLVAVSRYEDVKSVLRDTGTFSSARGLGSREAERRQQLDAHGLEKFEAMTAFEGRSLTQAVDPEHSRIRRFVNATFASSGIEPLRQEVVQIVEGLLDRAEATAEDDTFDLISQFSYLLPLEVVCRLLGVNDVDVSTVRAWAKEIRKGVGTTYSNLDEAYDALQHYREYVTQVIREQRADPASATPLFAQLISTDEDGTSLSEEDLVSIFIQMMTSGNTNDLIANSVIAMQERPDQWELLRQNPDKVRGAVEEFFRFCPSIQAIHRVAARDCEIGGFAVHAGETIRVLLASANHDESKFDNAETLDVTRKNARQHVGLGFGMHTCLGQWLARQEAEVALTAMMRRYPQLRVTGPVTFRLNFTIHGPDELLVRMR